MYSHRCGQGCLCRLGLATEWIEMRLTSGYIRRKLCLGLATEWIEIVHKAPAAKSRRSLGLATEWIEMPCL